MNTITRTTLAAAAISGLGLAGTMAPAVAHTSTEHDRVDQTQVNQVDERYDETSSEFDDNGTFDFQDLLSQYNNDGFLEGLFSDNGDNADGDNASGNGGNASGNDVDPSVTVDPQVSVDPEVNPQVNPEVDGNGSGNDLANDLGNGNTVGSDLGNVTGNDVAPEIGNDDTLGSGNDTGIADGLLSGNHVDGGGVDGNEVGGDLGGDVTGDITGNDLGSDNETDASQESSQQSDDDTSTTDVDGDDYDLADNADGSDDEGLLGGLL